MKRCVQLAWGRHCIGRPTNCLKTGMLSDDSVMLGPTRLMAPSCHGHGELQAGFLSTREHPRRHAEAAAGHEDYSGFGTFVFERRIDEAAQRSV